MKQNECIWAIICALIFSGSIYGLTVHAENSNTNLENPVLIWEFAPYCPNDLEFVVLKSTGTVCNLSGYVLTDGEGKIIFENVEIPAYGQIVIANNGSAYLNCFSQMPDIDLRTAKNLSVKGIFKLANTNDELFLYSADGRLVDSVAYGRERLIDGWTGNLLRTPSFGTIYLRNSVKDSNTTSDWTITKIGRTHLPVTRYQNVNISAYVTPDAGLSAVLETLKKARNEILLCTYTIDSQDIVDMLENASRKNVSVNVLVESSPVGGMSTAEKNAIVKIAGFANLTFYGVSQHVRFDCMHAKYLIVDRKWILISSENFKTTSYPDKGIEGNRGWGVVVESPELATNLAKIFWNDKNSAFGDTGKLTIPQVSGGEEYKGNQNRTISNFSEVNAVANISLLLSPDNALDYLLRAISEAKESVMIEAMEMPLLWDDSLNPFVVAIKSIAEKGVNVRLLLDGSMAGRKISGETMEYLNTLANGNISVKIINNRAHGYRITHTKGFVIDGKYVYLGSMNFCRSAFMENRETGVFIESMKIGKYFSEVFEFDWKNDFQKPRAYIGMPAKGAVGENLRFDGSASADNTEIVSYFWDFNNDGIPDATGPVVKYTFTKAGKYKVSLRVIDAAGNENSTSREITIVSAEPVHAEEGINWIWMLIPIAIVLVILLKFGGKKSYGFVEKMRYKLR